MKTEDKRYIYNPKPEIDEFWSDCIEQKDKKQSKQNINQKSRSKNINYAYYQHNQHSSHGKNSNSRYNKSRTYNSSNSFIQSNININSSTHNLNKNSKINSSVERFLTNIFNKHPSFVDEIKEEERKKLRSRNAKLRCIGLYAYGLEFQKEMRMLKERNDEEKKINDMSKCTFKPKLNKKISYLGDKVYYERGVNRLYKKNVKKFLNKSVDNIHNNKNNNDFEKCTFKPKLESDPIAMKKMFRNNSISDKKGNPEFLLRYTKARDEYLIRRFKKMYRKEDSYDYSLLSLTKRLCNNQYRNYLNVNNTVLAFGETIAPDNPIHSSIADFRGLSIQTEVPGQKKTPRVNSYIINLRKNLQSLDLNEE